MHIGEKDKPSYVRQTVKHDGSLMMIWGCMTIVDCGKESTKPGNKPVLMNIEDS
jgi:hypothetical protein